VEPSKRKEQQTLPFSPANDRGPATENSLTKALGAEGPSSEISDNEDLFRSQADGFFE
jgi:hypothetical protein